MGANYLHETHTPSGASTVVRPYWVTWALWLFPMITGVLVIIGWITDTEMLKSIQPGLPPMNPVTAMCFIAVAATMFALAHGWVRTTWVLATLVGAIGAGKFLELWFGTIAVDRVLFTSQISAEAVGVGRMAPNTAAAMVLICASLHLAGWKHRSAPLVAHGCAATVGLIALFAVVGYLFGVSPLNTLGALRPMAIHTAATLLVVAAGLVCLRPGGVWNVLADPGPAGALARLTLPTAVFIPIVIGAARLWGEEAGFYGTAAGVSLEVIANVALVCLLLVMTTVALLRTDRERLEREKALHRSQEVAHVGHFTLAEDGAASWSSELFRIHGLPRDRAAPSLDEWLLLHHEEDRQRFRQSVEQACATAGVGEYRGRIVRPDGDCRFVWAQLMCETAEQVDGTAGAGGRRIFGVMADVSDLESARRSAEAAAEAKAQFLANMSHEIRTPLSGVMGFAELLLKSDLTDEQREQAQLIHESGRALLLLLNDILDWSKIDAGRIDIHTEPLCLRHLLKQCKALMEPAAKAKGVHLHLQLDSSLPDFFEVDGLRVKQVILNLLGNAVKFTNEGFVLLEMKRGEPGTVTFKVQDTGIGIPTERKDQVFAEFVQANASVSKRFGGSGLGLSISRHLVDLMGGSLELESELGQGTVVTFTLPLKESKLLPAASRTAQSLEATNSAPARILLVEDMEVNQKLAVTMLTHLGHHVEVASNGLEALHWAKRHLCGEVHFDVVLMDIQMPEMDGLTASRCIRQLGGSLQSLRIVGLSANAYASDIEACREAGMDDHLSKPFAMEELAIAVARATAAPAQPVGLRGGPAVEQLRPLFAETCAGFASRLAQLRESLASVSAADIAEDLRAIAHKLSGTAGTFGYATLADVATDAELALLTARKENAVGRELTSLQLDKLADALEKRAA